MAWAGTGYQAWLGARFTHEDPRVCEDYVRRNQKKLKAENEQLKEKLAKVKDALSDGAETPPNG